MRNFDDDTKENRNKYNPHWSKVPNYPYRILINGSSWSGKINAWLNLIHHQEKGDRDDEDDDDIN